MHGRGIRDRELGPARTIERPGVAQGISARLLASKEHDLVAASPSRRYSHAPAAGSRRAPASSSYRRTPRYREGRRWSRSRQRARPRCPAWPPWPRRASTLATGSRRVGHGREGGALVALRVPRPSVLGACVFACCGPRVRRLRRHERPRLSARRSARRSVVQHLEIALRVWFDASRGGRRNLLPLGRQRRCRRHHPGRRGTREPERRCARGKPTRLEQRHPRACHARQRVF